MVVGSYMSCFTKVTTVKVMNRFGELVPPYIYPRKLERRCVSPFRPDFMFRPLSYCHVPSILESVLLALLLFFVSANMR